MIVDMREGRHHDALQHLQQLRRAHPRNRLLSLNYAVAALAAAQPAVADQVLTEWMAAPDWSASPTVLGEAALWFAHRGTARARTAPPHRGGDHGSAARSRGEPTGLGRRPHPRAARRRGPRGGRARPRTTRVRVGARSVGSRRRRLGGQGRDAEAERAEALTGAQAHAQSPPVRQHMPDRPSLQSRIQPFAMGLQ
jgi:hypothetical protein